MLLHSLSITHDFVLQVDNALDGVRLYFVRPASASNAAALALTRTRIIAARLAHGSCKRALTALLGVQPDQVSCSCEYHSFMLDGWRWRTALLPRNSEPTSLL